MVRLGAESAVQSGMVWWGRHGMAWLGKAWQDQAWQVWYVMVRQGQVW